MKTSQLGRMMKEMIIVLLFILFVNVLEASSNSVNGSECIHNGKTYVDGYNVSFDGCNTCVCRSGTMQCTEKLCTEDSSCVISGRYYSSGTPVPSIDCNHCSCSNGFVICTKKSCISKDAGRIKETVS